MLKLYNTLTRKLEIFKPYKKGEVKMVSCGPSIYQMPHIGNYRTFVFEDILHRYLEYLGFNVKRVLTITDIEDKAIAEAEKQNLSLKDLTDRNFKKFIGELRKLKVKIPDYLQRSSDTVERTVVLIEILLQKGYAYWFTYNGRRNVYFDPLKFDDFGKLFGLDMSKWPEKKRRFHRDTYIGNRWNKGDFVLWHGYKDGDTVFWDTRIGRGRPSWNIQDPSMVPEDFNFKVDIWCSGIDSTYRHHDYIIAIVESIIGKPFVNYWIHAAHLIFEGEKMSKRKGNIKYSKDLLATECVWNHIRFFFIYGHYRKKLNFTFEDYNKICKQLKNFRKMVRKLNDVKESDHESSVEAKKLVQGITQKFEESMNNDLHVKNAFDSLFETITRLVELYEIHSLSIQGAQEALEKIKSIDYVLQVIF